MTRPRAQSQGFVENLTGPVLGMLHPIYTPLIEIAPMNTPVVVAEDDAVIFTSANGVACAPDGSGQMAFCVGAATTKAAAARGWQAQQSGETSHELIQNLRSVAPSQRLWHLAGVHTRGSVAERLGAQGIKVTYVPIYDQALLPLTNAAKMALSRETDVIVPLFSPRTAKQFMSGASDSVGVHLIVISETVAAVIEGFGAKSLEIAAAPNAIDMAELIEKRAHALVMG